MILDYEKLLESINEDQTNKEVIKESFMEVVEEAYFGKTEGIKKMEECISTLVDIIKKEHGTKKAKHYLNKHIAAKELNKIVEKEFGFAQATLDWSYDFDTMGSAFTIPMINNGIPEVHNMASKMHYNKTGEVKATEKQKLYVCVNPGFITLFDLNAEETTAIILHEIGHNINLSATVAALSAISLVGNPWSIMGRAMGVFQANMINDNAEAEANVDVKKTEDATGEYIDEAREAVEKFLQDDSRVYTKLFSFFKGTALGAAGIVLLTKFRKYVMPVLKSFANKSNIKSGISFIANALSGYANEKYSDSFATAYGYGPALMAGLKKFEDKLDLVPTDKTKKVYPMYEFVSVVSSMFTYIADPHPDTQTRLRSQVDKLKRELKNNDLPPEMRKMIAEDLLKAEKIYHEFANLSEEDRKKCTRISRKISEKFFGGKMNVKEILNVLWSKSEL